jgi:hypothetical protein
MVEVGSIGFAIMIPIMARWRHYGRERSASRGIGVYAAPGARLWLSGGPTSEINELALTKP